MHNRSHLTGSATVLVEVGEEWKVSYNKSHLIGSSTVSVDSAVQQVTPHWLFQSLSGQCRTTGHTSSAPPQSQWRWERNRQCRTTGHTSLAPPPPEWRWERSGKCRTTGHTSLAPPPPEWRWERSGQCCTTGHTSLAPPAPRRPSGQPSTSSLFVGWLVA